MKVAILGGSFNPLHIGHAMIADTVSKEFGYDKIIFVPTYNPPHKIIKSTVTPEQRLSLVKSFCEAEGSGRFVAESCEIDRGGISYTSETLEFLNEKYKNELTGKLAFIMGEEIAAEFDKWKNPEHVLEIADLIIAKRHPNQNGVNDANFANTPSGNYAGEFNTNFDSENFPYKFIMMENPMLPVSSTEIRARIAENKSWRYLVPEAVYKFIAEHNLYK